MQGCAKELEFQNAGSGSFRVRTCHVPERALPNWLEGWRVLAMRRSVVDAPTRLQKGAALSGALQSCS